MMNVLTVEVTVEGKPTKFTTVEVNDNKTENNRMCVGCVAASDGKPSRSELCLLLNTRRSMLFCSDIIWVKEN